MKSVHISGDKGETFSCKVGQSSLDCNGMTTEVTCETGEKLAYAPTGDRRLGHVVHPEGETQVRACESRSDDLTLFLPPSIPPLCDSLRSP